jgi:glycosyltransferase involved in cell wall biosynthesis
MNIAIATTEFVSETIYDGGLANYTYKLAKYLKSQNHGVTVFLITDENAEINFEGIKVIKIKTEDYYWLIKYQLKRVGLGFLITTKIKHKIQTLEISYSLNKFLKKHIAAQPIDIIHYPNLAALAYYRLKKVPAVVRLSGSTQMAQVFGGYGEDDLKVKIQANLEYKAMKKADAVFGPSKMIAAMTEKEVNKKITVIETPYLKPNVELDTTVYNQYLKGKKYLLFFGSIGLIKGVGTITEIIFDFFEKHPDYYFVFIGKKVNNQINSVPIWDHLIQKSKQHANKIIYINSLRHDKLFPVIINAECVVLPSLIDNFPNTCVEAMANNKIVIGTFGNGFDQLIKDSKNGFLINVNDSKMLLHNINLVLTMPHEKKEQMEKAAKLRTDLLHPDIVLNQLVTLYKNTISNFKN